MGCLAGSASAVTWWNSSSYSTIEYASLASGLTVTTAQTPISLTTNPNNPSYANASAINNAGISPIHANTSAASDGTIDNTVTHSDANASSGTYVLIVKNNNSSDTTFSFVWHWMVSAIGNADPTDSVFGDANVFLGGNVVNASHEASIFDTGSDSLSGDDSYSFVIPAGVSKSFSVRSDASGSADLNNVPEPSTVALLVGIGVSGSVLLRRRRK